MHAVICDIYGTLLEVGPPPPDAAEQWSRLWRTTLGVVDIPALDDFSAAVEAGVPAAHARARERDRGLQQPEVDWPALAATPFPILAQLPPPQTAEFFFTHARCCRSSRLAEDAADCLGALQRAGVVVGIASNAQACTRRELEAAMTAAGVDASILDPDASFYSYEHGVAKPDPRVFDFLSGRLLARGITRPNILMVGDRPEADLEPARAAGWRTWHLTRHPGPEAGPWAALHTWLELTML